MIAEAELVNERTRLFTLGLAGLAILLVLTALLFYSRYRSKKKSAQELERKNLLIEEERQRSDELLLNILPESVAAELKKKGSAEAQLFGDVTVLFTDFVGFTTVSERLTPKELVNELDTCFRAFDHIMARYNIEKIKTVGDAYLAVCGLPESNPKHAENVGVGSVTPLSVPANLAVKPDKK